jgi:hypothetical protein
MSVLAYMLIIYTMIFDSSDRLRGDAVSYGESLQTVHRNVASSFSTVKQPFLDCWTLEDVGDDLIDIVSHPRRI